MERIMVWAMRNPRIVLLGVFIVSLIAASQLPKLQVAITPQSLIIEGVVVGVLRQGKGKGFLQ